jgi:uncharacterized protein YbaR (Trm112 family)
MAISQDLLEILACPKCKGPLTLAPDKSALDCFACKLRYLIEDDIPVLLTSEARPLD